MKVIDHFFDVKTSKSGIREIECPDVMTEEEGKAHHAKRVVEEERQAERQRIREELIEKLVDDHLAKVK